MPNGIINIKDFFEVIVKWYDRFGRNFSWRKPNSSAYEVLISEILLRRTIAERVEKVFKPFIKKYPNQLSLKNADPEELQEVICSLGLTERYKCLIQAAIYLDQPSDFSLESLKRIKGVGDYISGAFLIFYKNQNHPIIDSNIRRIFKRYFRIMSDNQIKSILTRNANLTRLKDFYYGIIDFGALVCKPKPVCTKCQLFNSCETNK